ncbi:MAG TPA: TetR/AcrR family transcriptional regulator [Anaerolineae bacterium]|nr:TetR/AcrR family transcriptional regulator [Anaerolineae bacterium]HIQ04575.1 TetR/AcrR family transcriptional regulator [Anaerolineae bacterium]
MALQLRGEATRSHILDVAAACFAERGYDATSVAEICQRAGVTKGAFYHHFPSKQALFLELLDRWLTGLETQLKAIRGEAETIPKALLQMAGMARQIFREAGGQLPIFLEFWNKAIHDPAIWEATIAPYRQFHAFFAAMIETGIEEGTLCAVDSRVAAQALVSLAVGLVLQGLLDPQGADWEQVAREGVRILLQGLERKT